MNKKYLGLTLLIILLVTTASILAIKTPAKKDNTPPTDFSLITPQDNSIISDTTPELTWRASKDSESGIDHYEIWMDEKNLENIPAPGLGISKLFYLFSASKYREKTLPDQWEIVVNKTSSLQPGTHNWRIVAVNSQGIKKESDESFRFELFEKTTPIYTNENIELGKGHFLWAIGGKIEDQACLDDTLVYNINEDAWYEMADMPHAVQGAGWTLYENKIYSFGGKTEAHKGSSAYVQVYNIENDSWTVLDNMPRPRSKLGKFYPEINGKVYLFGGDNEAGRYKRVNWNWEYNLETNTWNTNVSNAPYSQSFPIVTYENGWLYYTSGNTGSEGPINDYPGALNQRYNPRTDVWEVMSPVPDPVTDGAGDKWNNNLHVIGGWDTNPGFDWVFDWNYAKHWVYNYENDSWSYAPDLPNEWHHQGVRAGDDRLWSYLGRIGLNHVNKVFYWDGNSWTEKNPAPIGGKMNFGTIHTTIGPVKT